MMRDYPGEILRGIVLGELGYHRCIVCDGTGYQNWDENGDDVKSGKTSNPDRDHGECENCDGLGFIITENIQ